MQQLAWREALDQAADKAHVQALDDQVAAQERALLDELEQTLDRRGDAVAAAAQVRALMFVARFRAAIETRLEALGH
jgi:molecular chaperone HscB